MAIGAPLEAGNENLNPGQGAVFIFERENSKWIQSSHTQVQSGQQSDSFGFTLSMDGTGNSIVIGAPSEDSVGEDGQVGNNNDLENSGALYLFQNSKGQ